eukprot:gene15394-18808_t
MVTRSADPGCGQRIQEMSTTYLFGISGKFRRTRQISESRQAFPDSSASVGCASQHSMREILRGTTTKRGPFMPVLNRASELQPEVAEWRRHLHQNPELLFDVHGTAAFVTEKLKEFGCDVVKTGI